MGCCGLLFKMLYSITIVLPLLALQAALETILCCDCRRRKLARTRAASAQALTNRGLAAISTDIRLGQVQILQFSRVCDVPIDLCACMRSRRILCLNASNSTNRRSNCIACSLGEWN